MFYKRFLVLCSERGISPSRAAEEIGIAKSRVTGWKSGEIPQNATLLKLAEFFGVSTEYLIGDAPRSSAYDSVPSESELKVALFGGDVDVTDAMWEEARAYAQVIAARERGRRNDK